MLQMSEIKEKLNAGEIKKGLAKREYGRVSLNQDLDTVMLLQLVLLLTNTSLVLFDSAEILECRCLLLGPSSLAIIAGHHCLTTLGASLGLGEGQVVAHVVCVVGQQTVDQDRVARLVDRTLGKKYC